MKPLFAILTAVILTGTGCYLSGSCPPAEELERVPVPTGTFVQRGDVHTFDYVTESETPFDDLTDAVADVDRENGRVILTYQNQAGQTVRIEYEVTDSRFDL